MRAPRLLPLALILPLVLIASACSGSDDSNDGSTKQTKPSSTAVPFEGTNWVLTNRSDLGVDLEQVAVTAEFTADSMSGSSGCNTYRAPIARDDPKLEVTGPIAVTQMACIGGPTGVEQAYLAALPKVRTYAIDGDRLTLRNLGGKTLLVYRASGVADILGTWTATSLYTGDAIQSVALGTTVTAEFDRQKVSGLTGCADEGFFGKAAITRATISLSALVITMPAGSTNRGLGRPCSAAVADQATNYLAALERARTWEVVGNRLTLFREGGTIAATFERA